MEATKRAGTQPGYKVDRNELGMTQREREVAAGLVLGENMVEVGKRLGLRKQRILQLVQSMEEKGVLKRHKKWIVVKAPKIG